MSTPCRILRTLYDLGRIIDQNPGVLHSRSRPAPAQGAYWHPAATISTIASGLDDNEQHPPADIELAAPVTASQVYHAALLNGNTLDDLLAGFAGAENAMPLENGDTAGPASQKHSRYRNSSIQTTPEALLSPRKPSSTLGTDVQSTVTVTQDGPYGHFTKVPDTPTPAIAKIEERKDSHQDEPSPAPSGHSVPATDDSHLDCDDKHAHELRGCPTCARRHAQSRLPRPLSQKERSVQHAVSADPVLSAAVIESGSPVRRNRLQRRIRTGAGT